MPTKNENCPICKVALVSTTAGTDLHCNVCGRDWYYMLVDGKQTLCSRMRKVFLRKSIAVGQELDDCLISQEEMGELATLVKAIRKLVPTITFLPNPPSASEVVVVEYLLPNGVPRMYFWSLGDKALVRASRKLLITSEVLSSGETAVYARKIDEPEEEEELEIVPTMQGITEAVENLIKIKSQQSQQTKG